MHYKLVCVVRDQIIMKIFIVLASVVLAINAVSDRELWQEFKVEHGKTYRNLLEEQVRFGIFQDNLRTIEQHNEKYERNEKSYSLAMNQFGDMSHEEFKNTILSKPIPQMPTPTEQFEGTPGFAAPSSVNWVSQGAVTGVKNQGQCGSCWAFSTTGALEGAYFLKNGKLESFSEQDLVDCATRNYGCDGGWMEVAFEFVRDHGIPTESAYPYDAREHACQNKAAFTSIRGYVSVKHTESALLEAVATIGPISIALDADLFQFYHSGVFDERSCGRELNHGVLAVGYGSENGKDYWLVKNSWAASWGEQGYIKIARNSNQCGISDNPNYPVF